MKSTDPIPELSAWPISPRRRALLNFSSLVLSATQQQNPLIRPDCLQKFRWLQCKRPQCIWQVIEADISVRGAAKGRKRGSAELFYLDLNSNQDSYRVIFLMNYLAIRQLSSYVLYKWELNVVIHDGLRGCVEYFIFLQCGQIVSFHSHEMSTCC